MSLRSSKILGEGLTYDDVLLVPAYSEVHPAHVQIRSVFSRNIQLKAPIVSAAMDTVTGSEMAIAVAQQGGIGVIHKNMSIESQAVAVRRVKRSESGMIQDPITISETSTAGDAMQIMSEHGIGGIPVVDDNHRLVGIVTNRDLRFQKNKQEPVRNIMTAENLVTADRGTTLSKAESILQEFKIEKLPVIDEDRRLVGLITYRDIIKIRKHPNSCKDQYGRLRVAAAVGVTRDAMERITALVEAGVDAVVIDTAHGHTKGVVQVLEKAKSTFGDIDIVVGNVATADGGKYLADAGADAVKVGIGPGSICTTRVVAGVGVPQLTAIMEVSEVLKPMGVPVIADGGLRYSGDIVKALAAGASSVMIGSMFAGVEESPGETIIYEGRKFKAYRGMGSIEAMQSGSRDRYFQEDEQDALKLVPEGISGKVPYKGTLAEVMYQLVGGLKAGMGYCGAKDVLALENARFMRITNAGIRESHPHNVSITREAPNYSTR